MRSIHCRPSDTEHQRTRLWAFLLMFVHVIPSFLISVSVSLLQLFLGRPPFLLPCGFHVRACRVMLTSSILPQGTVCPIQLQFCLTICFPTGSQSALCHYFSLGTLSNHQILNMVRKHQLTKVWIFCWFFLVVRQVSQPYRKTVFTLELKTISFVLL